MSNPRFSCKEIAEALGHGKEIKNGDGSYNTICPAHNDAGPSLSIHEKGGKILVRCHAGCSQQEVINELKDRGLWAVTKVRTWTVKPQAPSGTQVPTGVKHPKFGEPSARWVYRNKAGNIAGIIYRFNYKDDKGIPHKEIVPFCWSMSDEGEQRFWWKQMPEPRTLYNEDKLVNWKGPILLVEGEKSCDAAQRMFGETHLCMTWPGGGNAVKKAGFKVLKGRDVVLWPDADAPGDKTMRWVAEILVEEEARSIKRVELPEELYQYILPNQEVGGGWDLADDMPPEIIFDPKTLLAMAKDYKPEGDEVIDRFNRKFALVMVGGQAVVLFEERINENGSTEIKYFSPTAFEKFYGNNVVIQGKTQIPESIYWMKHTNRRSYTSVIFEPNAKGNGAYNLWRGFSVEPDPSGEFTLLEEHVRQNLANGDESLFRWIMGWFAHIIQHPNSKTGTSLAIRGRQGTGKTILGKIMGQLYRPHYVLVEDSRYVLGNFNSHMASTLLLHADEAFFAGDPRHVGKLRGMITSDTHRLELKGKESFELNNYIRLLITSNSDFIIPAAFEERRFGVLDAGEGRLQDKSFFRAMWKQMQNGGFGGLLYYLQNFDLNSVDVTTIPVTRALQEQKLHSLDGVVRFWFERLYEGQILPFRGGAWPDSIAVEELYGAYVKRSESWGERRRVDLPTFGKELRKLWPGMKISKRKLKNKRPDPNGYQVEVDEWVYDLLPLELHREAFGVVSGDIEWPETPEYTETKSDDSSDSGTRFDDVPF